MEKKPGRPRLTEEEKARRKEEREQKARSEAEPPKKRKRGRPPKKASEPLKIKGFSEEQIRKAKAQKLLLPHELLLLWANGIEFGGLAPTEAQQIYAAVAAAPYYAPKLANVQVKQDVRVRAVISAQPMTQQQWQDKYLKTQENEVKELDPGAVTSTGGASPVVGTLGEIKSHGLEKVMGEGGELTVPADYEVIDR